MTSAFSWQNSVSLCPASFRIPRPNLPVTPGVFLASYFCIPVPYSESESCSVVSDSLRPRGLYRPWGHKELGTAERFYIF